MAKTFPGGTQVRRGYYINTRSFEFANIDKDGAALPGGPDAKYLRIPVAVAMAAAPALGGLFVVAMPFIGFGLLGYAIVKRFAGGAKEVAATVASPAMPAGSAALTGTPSEEKPAEKAPTDARVEELAKEIEAKRAEK